MITFDNSRFDDLYIVYDWCTGTQHQCFRNIDDAFNHAVSLRYSSQLRFWVIKKGGKVVTHYLPF